ncbi:MAG: biotin carboxylase N-terminal domain-containing protein [Arenicellales bacterium]|jgi:3-methylcrotonyl-CoA carboxylase alpha subunit|nr:biotin carboxylase N-terminal domain-containing protein [Arenicellales bacterium]
MLRTVLVANRGEIACRIIRTAKRVGLRTVAVYSEADIRAPHVEMADESVNIGPAPVAESYLNPDRILDAAKSSASDTIHPGYGFLSENAAFARACEAAGLIFVGPHVHTIETMSDKAQAKQVAEQAGVPVLDGIHSEDQSVTGLVSNGTTLGFPLIIKPVSGGGGKGMHIADTPAELQVLIPTSQREAQTAFGDDRLLLERYLDQPRHIEVQIFGDQHGNVVHMFERDCSLQRRHQKVIEEAPAQNLRPELRTQLTEAAVAIAKAINYRGAGTVEFLVSGDEFFFMEMNTRLQVEHPVTEMITGIDLVEWQFKVAAGKHLPCKQNQILCLGHSVEARLYAEEIHNGFLPSAGDLLWLRFPPDNEHVRVDIGVRTGDSIGIHYDPMIAKIIVHDCEPRRSWQRLMQALRHCGVAGLGTNLPLLRGLSSHTAVRCADTDTGFIERNANELVNANATDVSAATALAAFYLWRNGPFCQRHDRRGDADSPWSSASGWRMNLPPELRFNFEIDGVAREVVAKANGNTLDAQIEDRCCRVFESMTPGEDLFIVLDGQILRGTALMSGQNLLAGVNGLFFTVSDSQSAQSSQIDQNSGTVQATMTGRVIQILAKPGDQVVKGDPVIVLEAMKMEHNLTAPVTGQVRTLDTNLDQFVEQGHILATIDPEPAPLTEI